MRRHMVIRLIQVLMAGAIGWLAGAAPGQTTSAPAGAQTAAEGAGENTMKFQFVDAPVESILDAISTRLGIEIDRAQPVPGRITVIVPHAVDADEAMRLLNAILAPAQCTAIPIARQNADGTPRRAVRIGTLEEGRKGEIPVN